MVLRYEGANFLRQRLALSLLSGRDVEITNIRADRHDPTEIGLRPSEVSLLELIDKVTDGGRVHIDETGTELKFHPGTLVGIDKDNIHGMHTCAPDRGISYYLELLAAISPFTRDGIFIKLRGVTHGSSDVSVDLFKLSFVPFLKKIGVPDGVNLMIIKHGISPLGGGLVEYTCPSLDKIVPFDFSHVGRVQRVRGVSFVQNVAPMFTVRAIDKTRMLLNNFLPDVWVYANRAKVADGQSQGYGLALVAETMNGCHIGSDMTIDENVLKQLVSQVSKSEKDWNEAEWAGYLCASRLLCEINSGGAVDSSTQWIAVLVLALTDDTSKIRLGRLTPYTVQLMRHILDFFGIKYKIDEVDGDCAIVECVGVGLKNLARRTQ